VLLWTKGSLSGSELLTPMGSLVLPGSWPREQLSKFGSGLATLSLTETIWRTKFCLGQRLGGWTTFIQNQQRAAIKTTLGLANLLGVMFIGGRRVYHLVSIPFYCLKKERLTVNLFMFTQSVKNRLVRTNFSPQPERGLLPET